MALELIFKFAIAYSTKISNISICHYSFSVIKRVKSTWTFTLSQNLHTRAETRREI